MDTFFGLLQEVTHDSFIAVVYALVTLTVVFLVVAIRRILPKNKRDSTLPPRRESPS
jgi:hypothetical protein